MFTTLLASRFFKILAPLALVAALALAITFYGSARYKAGRAYEVALVKAATDKLLQEAATSADKAERQSVARQLDFAAAQEYEKERIDAAIENGLSPADALFGTTP